MLSSKDMPLYLVAVKSFLRFYPSVAVIVYSDGTLRQRELAVLQHHVPGCKIVSAEEANDRARRVLGPDSFMHRCRDWDPSYRRVIDTELWGATSKRIILDADVLVLRPPQEVIDWIERGTSPFLMGQPPRQSASTGSTGTHIQSIFREKVKAISEKLALPDRFLDGTTGGFYGCVGGELSLEKIERLLHTCQELGIPMQQWGGEQCVVIYLLSTAGATRLDPSLYFNFDFEHVDQVNEANLVHFIGYCRFYQNVYPHCAAQVVKSLAEPARSQA